MAKNRCWRWPLKSSQEPTCSHDPNISWSTSSSDIEEPYMCKKHESINDYSKTWKQLALLSDRTKILDKNDTEASFDICYESSQNSSDLTNQTNLSPIIGNKQLEEFSPILYSSRISIENSRISPIIGGAGSLKRTETPKVLPIDFSQEWNNVSCDEVKVAGLDLDESLKSSTNYAIDQICSQECVEIISNSQLIDKINGNSYFSVSNTRTVPYKRKHYKKNGLAYKLQKALNRQQSEVGIWQHELFLANTSDYTSYDKSKILLFKSRIFWKEFGTTIIECDRFKDTNAKCIANTVVESIICYVIIGFNAVHNVTENGLFHLFPPYAIKSINYNGTDRLCYINVSKVLSVK